jgi:hypothetical protein
MTQYHEGQEVEVYKVTQDAYAGFKERRRWYKAKIVSLPYTTYSTQHQVMFLDGTRAAIDEDHIRPVEMVWMP